MHSVTSPEWSAFLGAVKAANLALGDPELVWYRGHPDVDHYLLATLLRYKNGLEKEKYLFESFQKFSDRIFKRRASEWETLFEMQHYVPRSGSTFKGANTEQHHGCCAGLPESY